MQSPEEALIRDMRTALHGVDTFLAQILNGSEQLSDPAMAKGSSLRALLSKVIEKSASYGKLRNTLSPSPSVNDMSQPAPNLPTKPGPSSQPFLPPKPAAAAPPLETVNGGELDQENYEEMDPVSRPRIDTSGSIYAPMASVAMGEEDGIMEETYEAMAPSPGHSGSGQVVRQPPPLTIQPEDLEMSEEMYTVMDSVQPPAGMMAAPPATLPPKPGATIGRGGTVITPMGDDDGAEGFEQAEYLAMDGADRTDADDFYEAPMVTAPTTQQHPPGQQQAETSKFRSESMPASKSYADDEDQYAYQIPAMALKIGVDNLTASTRRGFLDKLGGLGVSKWQRRFVVLSDGALYYFEGEKDKKPRNVVPIKGYRVEEDPEHSKGKKYAFKMTPLSSAEKGKNQSLKGKGGKVYCFRANSVDERKEWVGELRIALVRANRRSGSFADACSDFDQHGSGSGSVTSVPSNIPEEEAGMMYEAPGDSALSTSMSIPDDQDYLQPNELKPAVSSPPATVSDYLPPSDISKKRASSTFGKETDAVFSDNITPPRRDAPAASSNPYASRQQIQLPAPPPGAVDNPYQSRKQMQALPKVPVVADQNPYASRQQMRLPAVPANAPVAPVAPKAPTADPTYIDTRAIFVQLPDAKFKYEQVYVALWDYKPAARDELGFKRGEQVFIEEVLEDADWWVGRKKSNYDSDNFTGDRGLLVSAYMSPAYEKLI